MALIRIICDGGGRWGFGNLRRSATLGQVLAARGHRVRVEAASPTGQALLPEAPADTGEEALRLLDLPYVGDRWVNGAPVPVVALDYVGQATPDLTISIWQHGAGPGGGRSSVGLDYAIIRSDIVARAGRQGTAGALVLMGGGDDTGLSEKVALRLLAAGESAVTLIDGPLALICHPLPPTVRRLQSPPDLAEQMALCSWAVTSGGTAMMEMMCLGKAVHVVPRTPLEEGLAQLLYAQGGLLGVGLDNLSPAAAVHRATVAASAARLVDGRGADRICDLVESFL